MTFHIGWLILAVSYVTTRECNTFFTNGFVISGPLKPIAGLLTPSAEKLLSPITKPKKTGDDHLDSYADYKNNNYPTASESDRIKIPYQYTSSSNNNQNRNGFQSSGGLSRWEDSSGNLASNDRDDYVINGIPRRRGQRYDRNDEGSYRYGDSKESLQNQLWRTQETLRERTNEVVQLKSELRILQSRLQEQEAHYERFINDLQIQLGMGEGQRRWSSIGSRPRTVLSADNNSAVNHLGSKGFTEQATASATAATTEFHSKRDPMSAFYEEPSQERSQVYEPYRISVSDTKTPSRTTALWSNGQNPTSSYNQGFNEKATKAASPSINPFVSTQAGTQQMQKDDSPYNSQIENEMHPHLTLDGFGMDVHGPGPHVQEEFDFQRDSSVDPRMDMMSPGAAMNVSPPPPPYYYDNMGGVVPPGPPPGNFQPMWPPQQQQQAQPMNSNFMTNPPAPARFSSPQNHLITLNDQGLSSKSETIGDRAKASGYYGTTTSNQGGEQSSRAVFYDLGSKDSKQSNGNGSSNKTADTGADGRSSQSGTETAPSVQRIQPKASGETGEFVRNDDIVVGVVDPFDHLSQRQQSYDGKTPFTDREEKKKEQKSYTTAKQSSYGGTSSQESADNASSSYNGSNSNDFMYPPGGGMEEEPFGYGQYGGEDFYGRGPPESMFGFAPQGRYGVPGNFDPNVPYGSGYNDSNNWTPPGYYNGATSNMDRFNSFNNVGFYEDPSFHPMYQQEPSGPFFNPQFMNNYMSERRRPDEIAVLRPDASAFT